MRFGLLMVASLAATATGQRADTVVRAAGRPVHAGVAELRPELRVGVTDGDENYMIGAIDDIAVGANGTMYVLDRSVPAVRVYDAAGKFVKNIGRRGRGPGEYGYAAGIALAADGNLLLYDIGNARINVYTPAGDIVTSWPTHGGSGTASGRGLFTSDVTGIMYVRKPMWRPGQATRPRWGWVRYGADGAIRDTTYGPESPSEAILSAQVGGSAMTTGVPFAPVNYTVVSPLGYFVTSQSSRLAIDLHEAGKPIASVRRDIALQPVSSRERDSARADVIADMQKLDPSWSWNGPEIPKTKAAFEGLRVAADGFLWVALSKGPRFDDGSGPGGGGGSSRMGAGRGPGRSPGPTWSCPTEGWSVHDVYEPTGRYLGQVKFPEKISAIMIRGDFVWAATCTEDDAPQVVRYRIAWR
jgi:hypothetical protein